MLYLESPPSIAFQGVPLTLDAGKFLNYVNCIGQDLSADELDYLFSHVTMPRREKNTQVRKESSMSHAQVEKLVGLSTV